MPPSLQWPSDCPFPDPVHPAVREAATAFAMIADPEPESLDYFVNRLLAAGPNPGAVLLGLRSIDVQARATQLLLGEDMRRRAASAMNMQARVKMGEADPEAYAALAQSAMGMVDDVLAGWHRLDRLGRLRKAYLDATRRLGRDEPTAGATAEAAEFPGLALAFASGSEASP